MIYIMSDIHGNQRRFDSVMEQINLQPEDTLYVLGDVVDRYPGAISILQQIMAMPNAKMVLGNHEYLMLRALGQPYDSYRQMTPGLIEKTLRGWLVCGGKATYQHWLQLRKSQREEIIRYLHSLPVSYDLELNGVHYTLAHAAPPQEYEYFHRRYPSPSYFALWKPWRTCDELHGDYVFIHGHISTDNYQQNDPLEIFTRPDRIAIDCGSGFPERPGFGGRLACLRLDDMKVFYSNEGGN